MTQCFTDQHFDLVNEILPKVSAEGAYLMGLVSSLVMLSPDELKPTRELFERSAQCKTPVEAVRWFEEWERKASFARTPHVSTNARQRRGAPKHK